MKIPRRVRRSLVPLAAGLVLAGTAQSAVAGWSTLGGSPGDSSRVLACKTAISSPYFGPLWRITVVLISAPRASTGASLIVRRGAARTVVNRADLSASNGAWAAKVTYASRWVGDRYDAVASWYPGTGDSLRENAAVGGLRTC